MNPNGMTMLLTADICKHYGIPAWWVGKHVNGVRLTTILANVQP